ncbi:PepSY domain-containing protein [Chryseobacterium sp. BIGb0232]|uniref:PepSY-associated TM helix domain-containing protein n=1 Tax=Chryseobacterium sp. BIGb0232 TaxID=2940598 RepID=UPI000F47490D|nr:PepSY domain-containing protein [Chryseobacterium sp. BIGb0232]MCS4304231.1 putative iron-regulated membrane protein [Chryseobacterium sp. BIGb0232]ROS14116.1 putative iron-regulated membrane protein [Chryseobacterium nakagawai]
MKLKTAKRWFNWHKWTSLICTVFLLYLCVTGLPLIFHEEIEHLLEDNKEALAQNHEKLSLDKLVKIAESKYPGEKARFVFWDENEKNKVLFDIVDQPNAPYEKSKYLVLNEYTGEVLGAPRTDGLMNIILKLHTDMFLGIPGKLFLGLMGMLFMISIVSGIVLYGPIMKKYDFGMVRKNKSKRLKWLDTHNLLGIAITAWMVVVGFTGIINTLSDVIVGLWQQGQLAEMTAPYKNQKPLTGNFSSLEDAKKAAESTIKDMKVSIIAYPGTDFTSKHHYAVFMRGNTELTSKLLKPVLIDAKTGTVTDSRDMPWYVNALFISEPLHFGNYGGMILKVVWTVFDVFTILVLITGLYLWIARRKAEKQQKIVFTPKDSRK